MIGAQLRAIGRLFRLAAGLFAYGIWSTWRYGGADAQATVLPGIRRKWYAFGLRTAGVVVDYRGELSHEGALLLGNHVSWLDIPVLGYTADPRFLAKAEISRWPIIGWLARRNGTLFIQRGSNQAADTVQAMADALNQGGRVAFFPETTTGPGTYVRRFQPRLLAVAIATGASVQPVAIRYLPDPDGQASAAPFVLGDKFLPHAWNLLKRRETRVVVEFLPLIPVTETSTRRSLADAARLAVVNALGLPEAFPDEPIRWGE